MANWLVTGASSGIGYGIALAACSNFAFFIQKLLPHMPEERSGAIINISSTALKTHKENVENDHQEPGDLIKAGQVIVDVIGKDNPSKTLLLGSDTVKFVYDQLTQKLKEIKDWQDISKETDF